MVGDEVGFEAKLQVGFLVHEGDVFVEIVGCLALLLWVLLDVESSGEVVDVLGDVEFGDFLFLGGLVVVLGVGGGEVL